MPKDCVDYSNTIIYKIVCKYPNVTDVYVGHTTNFIQRKYAHKMACNKLTDKPKIYNVIRQNGGWDNWEMIEIGRYNCKNHIEARIKENEHYEKLNCTLNTVIPFINKYCKICSLDFSTKKDYDEHLLTNIHKTRFENLQITNEIVGSSKSSFFDISEQNIDIDIDDKNYDNDDYDYNDNDDETSETYKFICEICEYKTNRNSQYERHIKTSKHFENKNKKLYDKKYKCICGKKYNHRQSLSLHKKTCNYKDQEEVDCDKPITKELVMQLIQQNQNLQEMLHEQYNKMYEIAKEGKVITTNNNNNNTTNNNNFNLNVFLNETCKDAINLTDFIESLNVKLQDLEYTAKTSYAEGISKIFINGLSSLNVPDRPIHCSDAKRDILYIKDQDAWEKEDENKTKLTKAIKIVGHKNMKQISEWQKANPEYNNPDSKQNDRYQEMLCNAMSGSTKEEADKNYEKIIKNIAKEVVIDKQAYK